MADSKVSAMTGLSASQVTDKSTLFMPVINGASPANGKLSYPELMKLVAGDVGAPTIYKLVPSVSTTMGVLNTDWTVTSVLAPSVALVEYTSQTGVFNFTQVGLYKIVAVVHVKNFNADFNGDTNQWPIGATEVGTYLGRDAYNPGTMLPSPMAYRSCHNRYIPTADTAYIDRPFARFTDEYLMDYRQPNNPAEGKFTIGGFMTASGAASRPYFEIALTIVKLTTA